MTKAEIKAESPIGMFEDPRAKNFLIVGLVRDCGKTIEGDVLKIRSALNSFKHIQWLVIESDSRDDTAEKLKALEQNVENFRFISLGVLRDKFPLRTERIAFCRNRYLDELKNNQAYDNIDYVIVADLDGLNSLLNEQAFLSCWSRDDWDVCAAKQRGPYYDVWALRHKIWSPNDCWAQYRFMVKNHISKNKALFSAIHSRMIKVPEDSDWIEVDSAFGGFAIYRREVLEGVRYVGLSDCGEEVADHVALNHMIKSRHHRIFINPRLINAGYTEHTIQLSPALLPTVKRIFRRFSRSVKGLFESFGRGR